jgi:acyl carrier protein
MSYILTEVIAMVAVSTNIEAAKINSDSDFDSLGFDSLSITEMTVAIKRKFSVDADEDALARCLTVGEMAGIVTGLLERV